MADRQYGHEAVCQHLPHRDAGRWPKLWRRPQEADIDLALLELLQLLPGRHMHQLEGGVAVCLAELMHGARKDVMHRHGCRESHPNLPGIARCHLLHHLARLIQRGQRIAGLVQEQRPGGRQRRDGGSVRAAHCPIPPPKP